MVDCKTDILFQFTMSSPNLPSHLPSHMIVGRYDDLKSLDENMNLMGTILRYERDNEMVDCETDEKD